MVTFIEIFTFCFDGGGQHLATLRTNSGSSLSDHSWQAWGNSMWCGDITLVGYMQGTCLTNCAIVPGPNHQNCNAFKKIINTP